MTKLEAIAWAGSAANLSKLLGVSRAAICQWREVPVFRQWHLKAISNDELQPDPQLMESIRQQ